MDIPGRSWSVPLVGGLAAGVIAGLFGVGGGVLLVPLLVLQLGRRQHVAHATSLVGIILPAAVAASRFAADGAVAWWPALAITAGALAGVQVGAVVLHRVPERALRLLFALLLAATALRLLFGGAASGGGASPDPVVTVAAVASFVGVGLVSGTASALLGIGGGAVIVPALVLLLGFGQHLAEGTSLAAIVPTTLVGALTHARRGYTEWRLGWGLGLAGMLGGVLGAELALSLPADVLARGFGVLLAVVTFLLLRRPSSEDEDGADAADDRGGADDRDADDRDAVASGDRTVEVRPLAADNTDDWLRFFDGPAFARDDDWSGCYCYFDRFPGDAGSFDPSAGDRNRAAMLRQLDAGRVRGWLAYVDGEPVGWCHATSRIELPHLKVEAPLPGRTERVAVIACFVIAPGWRREGVAGRLLDAATRAFARQGFDVVEAYPPLHPRDPQRSYRGPLALYERAGFQVVAELDHGLIVRRTLSGDPPRGDARTGPAVR